nr:hypothetical protein [Tanacetum cinerariifolium]
MAGVDINTLTMEEYLALSRENQASSVVKQKVKGNVNFEIESQFIVSQDAVLLRFSDDKKSKTTKVKTLKAIPEWKSNLPEQSVNHYVEPYIPPIPFHIRLKQHVGEVLVHKTMESLKKIKINWPFLKEIRQTNNYPVYMKDLVANKQLNEDDGEVRMNPRSSALLQNLLHLKENDPGSFILPCSI